MSSQTGMLGAFRRRFILITMSLVGVVTLTVFAAIGVVEFQKMNDEIDMTLSRAVDEGGHGPMWDFMLDGFADSQEAPKMDSHGLTYCSFSVLFTDLESPRQVSNSANLDSDTVYAALAEVIEQTGLDDYPTLREPASGSVSQYGLLYKVKSATLGYQIAFVNKNILLDDFMPRVVMLGASWALLMLALFAITFFLSRYVTRPIERAWEDQQRFIADASHELKTPLTIIMANASILGASPEKTVAEQSTWVEGISAEATRMQRLTEDMLSLAQADAGVDTKQVMGTVDYSALAEGQVLQFDAVAFERGLLIESAIDEGLCVIGDELKLENMVKTLLENACKYAHSGTTIDVALHAQGKQAVLSVSNQGDTVPAEDVPHLFDRFYRSDKARTREGEATSFGLGLSIAKATAEMHSGSIEAQSNDGTTVFSVRIPLAK